MHKSGNGNAKVSELSWVWYGSRTSGTNRKIKVHWMPLQMRRTQNDLESSQ